MAGTFFKNNFEGVHFLVKTTLQVFPKDFTKLKLSVFMFLKFRNNVFTF